MGASGSVAAVLVGVDIWGVAAPKASFACLSGPLGGATAALPPAAGFVAGFAGGSPTCTRSADSLAPWMDARACAGGNTTVITVRV